MQNHPFINSILYRVAGAVLVILACSTGALLLYYYGYAEWLVAWLDSLVSVGLFSIAGFLFWYVTGVLRQVQAQVALALGVQAISIIGGYMVMTLVCSDHMEWFVSTIPFRFLFGILGWIILAQWYFIRWKEIRKGEEQDILSEDRQVLTETAAALPVEEALLDGISVKDGSRIHLIQLDELLYIQASGDYVTLFTSDGQYVKEQTMKYFESHLPERTFIRIHRSCIVNSDYIMRVELFGKETWQVRLKTGISLRASAGGYKLLKERLSL